MAQAVSITRQLIISAKLKWLLLPAIFSAQTIFSQNKDSVAVLKAVKVIPGAIDTPKAIKP